LYQLEKSPTKCRPSTNLPALDHTVHQLNSRSPPSWDRAPPPGKESRLRLRLQGRQHIHIQQEEALPEISTLTAHRPSFPTCLFHPRRVHLLCHLDSPSAASLPYLGLQEQAGPEFSGLYGSYRDFSQEFSSPSAHSLTWRSRSQANKPHAVQCCAITTIHRNTDKCFPQRLDNYRMISR
jgi:hypothetical protein